MKKVKVNTNRMAFLVGIIVLAIIIIVAIANSKNKDVATDNDAENEVTIIEGEKLAEAKTYNGLEVKNSKFKIEEDRTILTAEVYNNTGADTESQYININVLDKDGNKITSIGGSINAIKAGESTNIWTSFPTTGEEKKSYNIEITKEREKDESAETSNSQNGENNN